MNRFVKCGESCEVCWEEMIRNTTPQYGWAGGYNKRPFCPNEELPWHRMLSDKLELAEEPHPQSYLEELQREITALQKAHCRQ